MAAVTRHETVNIDVADAARLPHLGSEIANPGGSTVDRVVTRLLNVLGGPSSDAGATMAEWVLMVFLIALLAIAATGAVGEGVAAKLLEYVNS